MAHINKPGKVVAALVLCILIFLALYYSLIRKEAPAGFIETTGVMEATEVDLASKIPGRIEWLCCEEGGRIDKGAVAVRIDSRELKARVEEGMAALSAAEESVKEARLAVENAKLEREAAAYEVEAAEAEIKRSEALAKEAKDNLERVKGLFSGGFVATRDLDAAEAAYASNAALLSTARARLRSAGANLRNSTVKIRSAEARISTAVSRKAQAAAQLQVLEAGLDDTEIISPIDGVVAYKAYEAGEYVNPGSSVYTIYGLTERWARADLEETMIQEISLVSRAEVRLPGSDKAFTGKVVSIAEAGGFATQRDVTRGRSDIKTFRVKIGVENSSAELKPGMTVSVRIYLTGR